MTFFVNGIWRCSSRTAPDRGTTCCVGDVHSVTEQLSDQTSVSCLSTTSTGAGELEQRFLELAAFNGFFCWHTRFLGNVSNQVIEYWLFAFLAFSWNHGDCFFFCRTFAYADAASHTIHRRYCHCESVFFQTFTDHLSCLQACWSVSNFFLAQSEWTDGCMWADIRTTVTLDTFCFIPYWNHNSNTAFFVSSSALFKGTISMINESRYWQAVTVHLSNWFHDSLNHVDQFLVVAWQNFFYLLVFCICPVSWNVDLDIVVETSVDSIMVHLNDSFTLLREAAGSCIFHVVDCIFFWKNASQSEECGLEDCVGTFAQTDFDCFVDSVDGVQLDVVLSDVTFCFSWHMLVELFWSPLAVDEEYAAWFNVTNHLVAFCYIGWVVASNKVCFVDVVWALDRFVTKTQMGNGDTAGLLGVILEVCLYIFIGVVTDDLDGVLVCTNSTVAAQTPEFAFDGAFCSGVWSFFFFQGQMSNVIVDAQSKSCFWSFFGQLFINCKDACWSCVFGAQTVTTADDGSLTSCFAHSRHNIQMERFSISTWLFGTVQNSDLGSSFWDSSEQMFCREWTEQSYFNKTNFFALSGQVIDNFFCNVTDGAHSNDNTVSIWCTIVVEQLIVCTQFSVNFAHVFFNNSWNCIVVLVASFTMLEEDISVFMGTTHGWVFWVQSTFAECFNSIHIAHFFQVFVIPNLDLLDLVGGTETIKEVDEWNTALDGCQMSNSTQIHNFLWVGFSQHSKTGLTASINVGMIAKDVQCMGSNCSCRYVEYAREQLTSDFVHIWNHQQKTLGSGVCCGHSTSIQGAVYSTSCTSFGLHLHYLNGRTEDVLFALCRPLVYIVSHWAGRGDWVDAGNFCKCIRYICSSVVAVHGFHRSSHDVLFLLDGYMMVLQHIIHTYILNFSIF